MSQSRQSTQPRVPKYCLHKATGQARVFIEGRGIYLGKHGSPESHAKYNRLVAEYITGGSVRAPNGAPQAYTVGELVRDFLEDASAKFVVPEGRKSGTLGNLRVALRPLVLLFLDVPAVEFGPLSLETYRRELVRSGNARKTINSKVGMVRRAFKWGVQRELVPASVLVGLQALESLRRGRGGVPESAGRKPVAIEHVEAAIPFMPPMVQVMVKVNLLTGMRPGEVVVLRVCDIDRSEDVWIYRPSLHKNEWRDKPREVPLGPQAQELLLPFIRPGLQNRPLFSPQASEEERQKRRREERRTPLWKSHERSQEARRKQRAPRVLREHYSTGSYARAVTRACEQAGVPCWTPGQLRHTAGTRVRREHGLEAASGFLGHSKLETTQHYANTRLESAIQVARQNG